jgi:hypothetical protein
MQKPIFWLGLGLLAVQMASSAYGQAETAATAPEPTTKASLANSKATSERGVQSSSSTVASASVASPAVSASSPASGGAGTQASKQDKAVRTCKLSGTATSLASNVKSSTVNSCRAQCAGDDLCIMCCICIARGGDPSQCCY